VETQIKAIARKWGNSIAIVIPKEIVDKERIKEDEEIIIEVKKRRPKAGVLFGKFPQLKKWSTQELKDEARKGWESESDRQRWKNKN